MEAERYILFCRSIEECLTSNLEAPKVDVLLSDEISGSLRTMRNIVNAAQQQFESIERRHLVQRKGAKPKKKYERLRVKKGILKYSRI